MYLKHARYEMKTTFWYDFTIAERCGIDAIKDTYERAMAAWKENCVYLTELVIVLNWKICKWYEKEAYIAKVYNDLWEKADAYAVDNLKGEELNYFYRTTD